MTRKHIRMTTIMLCCLTTLVGCGSKTKPYLGNWYLMDDLGQMDVVQEGEALLLKPDIKGLKQTMVGAIRDEQVTVDVPMYGTVPLQLSEDKQHMSLLDLDFTRDPNEAKEKHLARAKKYGEDKIRDAYPYVRDSMFKLNTNCATGDWLGRRPSVIAGCQITADSETYDMVVDITMPDGTSVQVRSIDLADPNDFSPIRGVWSATEGRVLSLTEPNKQGIIGSIQGDVKQVDYSTRHCLSYLKKVSRNGFAFKVQQVSAGGLDCNGTGEEHFILLESNENQQQLEYTMNSGWNNVGMIIGSPNMTFRPTDQSPEDVPEKAGL